MPKIATAGLRPGLVDLTPTDTTREPRLGGDRDDSSRIVDEILLTLRDEGRPAAERIRAVYALRPSRDELAAAGDSLAKRAVDTLIGAGALTPVAPPSILKMDYHRLQTEADAALARGRVLQRMLTMLPDGWPLGARLADVLKTTPRPWLIRIVNELHYAGIHDLDELIENEDPDEPAG
jgi:hypothetical protein